MSIVTVSLFSGVSTGTLAIAGNRNLTKAIIIARNKFKEFQIQSLKGSDISNEKVDEYPGFTYSRDITRYEHEMFGPLDARIVTITVHWRENNRKKNYSIDYIFPE